MGIDKVELNRSGVNKLLREMALPDIERRTAAVADAAGPGAVAQTSVGRNRARGSVVGHDPKRLLKALEAGGD